MLLVRKYLCGRWDTVRGLRVFSRLSIVQVIGSRLTSQAVVADSDKNARVSTRQRHCSPSDVCGRWGLPPRAVPAFRGAAGPY